MPSPRLPLFIAILFLTSAAHSADVQCDKQKGQEWYDRGVAAFDARQNSEALAAFQKAHEQCPKYEILYNIGEVQAALGNAVRALETYRQYLEDGGGEISTERRQQVEQAIAEQERRIGRLSLSVQPDASEVWIDSERMGAEALVAPIPLDPGRHIIEVARDGYKTERQTFILEKQQVFELPIELQPLTPVPASLPVPTDQNAGPDSAVAATTDASPVPEPAPLVDAPAGASRPNLQRPIAYAVGGAGLVLAGIGIGVTAAGQAKHGDALDQWEAGDHDLARDTEADSQDQKTAGVAVIVTGGVALGAGTILFLTAKPGKRSSGSLRLSPWATGNATGAQVYGCW